MPAAVEAELNDYQEAYNKMVVTPPQDFMRMYLQKFFPNFREEQPQFWDWVSYGLMWDPSPEFIDRYQDYLNWQVLSRYHNFGVVGLKAGKKCEDVAILNFKNDNALYNHADKINVWFAIITFYIMTIYIEDDAWVRDHVKLSPIYERRNLLRTDPSEFTKLDTFTMHFFSKWAIKDGYEFLEMQHYIRNREAGGDPTDTNIWAQYAWEFVNELLGKTNSAG